MRRSKEAPMSANDLKDLLDRIDDTRELVLRSSAGWAPVHEAWSEAREDAAEAYCKWRRQRTRAAYATYRAAQDREDAAQDALAGFRPS
jgi:hypothetical protein